MTLYEILECTSGSCQVMTYSGSPMDLSLSSSSMSSSPMVPSCKTSESAACSGPSSNASGVDSSAVYSSGDGSRSVREVGMSKYAAVVGDTSLPAKDMASLSAALPLPMKRVEDANGVTHLICSRRT